MPLITLLIGSLATFLWTRYSNRVRQLDYYVSGLPVGNTNPPSLSVVAVSLFNKSDQDFADVVVDVTFSTKDGSKPKLTQSQATTPPAQTPSLPQTRPAISYDSALHLQYLMKIANRSDKPIWFANYTFENATAPDVELNVIQKGLEANQLPIGQSTNAMSGYLALVAECVSMVAIFVFFWWLARRSEKKAVEQFNAQQAVWKEQMQKINSNIK